MTNHGRWKVHYELGMDIRIFSLGFHQVLSVQILRVLEIYTHIGTYNVRVSFGQDFIGSGLVRIYNSNIRKMSMIFRYILDSDWLGIRIQKPKIPELDSKTQKYLKTLKIHEEPQNPLNLPKIKPENPKDTRKLPEYSNYIF